MLNETLYSMRPFVRYSRYVTTGDFKKFNSVICGFDNRLFYCKKGYGKFVIDNTEYSVSRGVLAIIPSGVGYLYIPNEEDPMELLALNFDYDRESCTTQTPIPPVKKELFDREAIISPTVFSDNTYLNGVLVLEKMNFVEKSLEEINSEYNKKEAMYDIRCSNILSSVLTRAVIRAGQESGSKAETLAGRVIEYIRENYSREITLEMLGEEFGYHPNYLGAVFVRQTGKPIYSYLVDYRIEQAISLLENTSSSVSEISALVGFCDISHFSKIFKRRTGYSPSAFRIR